MAFIDGGTSHSRAEVKCGRCGGCSGGCGGGWGIASLCRGRGGSCGGRGRGRGGGRNTDNSRALLLHRLLAGSDGLRRRGHSNTGLGVHLTDIAQGTRDSSTSALDLLLELFGDTGRGHRACTFVFDLERHHGARSRLQAAASREAAVAGSGLEDHLGLDPLGQVELAIHGDPCRLKRIQCVVTSRVECQEHRGGLLLAAGHGRGVASSNAVQILALLPCRHVSAGGALLHVLTGEAAVRMHATDRLGLEGSRLAEVRLDAGPVARSFLRRRAGLWTAVQHRSAELGNANVGFGIVRICACQRVLATGALSALVHTLRGDIGLLA
mmetsp:Transcript_75726/g.180993  ORF Transcript_75726/g.180993 Transcript_75726/m.180993 type:complete len:325 (-) Transcript_75726:1583-2557(-)